jgi:hypothetical protein
MVSFKLPFEVKKIHVPMYLQRDLLKKTRYLHNIMKMKDH